MSGNNNDTVLAVALLFGAYMMTRRQMVAAVPQQQQKGGKLSSLPGNIGTGVGQALGGALGSVLTSWLKPTPISTAANSPGANGTNYYDVSDTSSGSSTDWALPGVGEVGDTPWYENMA